MASASPLPGFRKVDEDGRPLDPYHHLRHPRAKYLLALLLDFDAIENTDINVLTAAVYQAFPSLENLRQQFEGRTMPQKLIELLFPLHHIHRKLPDDSKCFVGPYRPPFDENRVQYHIDPGWVMPPARRFYVPSSPAATSSAAARTPPAPQTPAAKVPASKSSENSTAATSPLTAASTPRAARSRGATVGFAQMIPSGWPVQRKKPKKKDRLDTPSPSASDAGQTTSPRTTRSMTGSLPNPRASQSVPPGQPLTIRLPRSKSAPGRFESSGVCSGAKATPPDAPAPTPQRFTSVGTPSPKSEDPTSPTLLFGKPGPALSKIPKPSHGQVFVLVPSVPSALKTARSEKLLGKRKATMDLSIEGSDDSARHCRRKTTSPPSKFERFKSPGRAPSAEPTHTQALSTELASQRAITANVEFEGKLRRFVDHSNGVINSIGVKALSDRFTEESAAPSILDYFDSLVNNSRDPAPEAGASKPATKKNDK
ncbi:hypothetical protein B0H11DRAFT_2214904 [Mycena galericulata]|nr:hypothetical protein B0H11DRAFT_2214904 [Mycena galericulata]